MSTISTINNVQEQLSGITSTSSSDSSSALSGETFEKALDFAMDAKSVVLPGAANLAIDAGVGILQESDLLSSVADATSMKEAMEGIFDELTIGISSSFVAALSGADSATAVTEVTENSVEKTTCIDSSSRATAASSSTAASTDTAVEEDSSDDASLLSADTLATTKTVVDSATPFLGSAAPIAGVASVTLSALEDLLRETEADKDKYKD